MGNSFPFTALTFTSRLHIQARIPPTKTRHAVGADTEAGTKRYFLMIYIHIMELLCQDLEPQFLEQPREWIAFCCKQSLCSALRVRAKPASHVTHFARQMSTAKVKKERKERKPLN